MNETPREDLFSEAARTEVRVLSVSELTRAIHSVLNGEFVNVTVAGEVSGVRAYPSGQTYFTLKDASSQLSCLIWKQRSLGFQLKDGLSVIAVGTVGVYQARGQMQLVVSSLSVRGKGTLFEQFETLKAQLLEEGLFDAEHKRPLPAMASVIGVVTSASGAVWHDIKKVMARRWPHMKLILRDARVQGEGAAEDIVRGIQEFNELGGVDALIVGRGGGSLEDLWAFNEESVARAIYNSKIPVVSAVGHETDTTIADFVADRRAATPSQAAEFLSPNRFEIARLIGGLLDTAEGLVRSLLREHLQTIRHFTGSYSFNKPQDVVRERMQRVDDLTSRLGQATGSNVLSSKHRLDTLTQNLRSVSPERATERIAARRAELSARLDRSVKTLLDFRANNLSSLEKGLKALGPGNVLTRGYAIVRAASGDVRSRAAQLHTGDDVTITFADASREARMK